MNKFEIGDIVYVKNYQYKNGEKGTGHCFVIIDDDGQAIDLNYFGFLISSNTQKATYPYNETINRDDTNNLKKDSIVKCDDLIEIAEKEIKFKIGSVDVEDLTRFLDTFAKYLETIK